MLNPEKPLAFEKFYMKIVGGNTLRAFHRKDKDAKGPTEIIREFIWNSKDEIIVGLKKVNSTADIDQLSDELFKKLKTKLEVNVQDHVLKNYNAVRKLVDLILEHVALIATELNDCRKQIMPFLRVPLDSFILNSDCLFTYQERKEYKLGVVGGGFSRIKTKEHYDKVQSHLIQVANSCEVSYPIYFDVLWRDRMNYQFNLINQNS